MQKSRMKKICMIVPKGLPLPAVKGGAIETIVTNIIEENEKSGNIKLTVVSMYDEKALKEANKFSNTNFIYIKKNIKYYLKALLVRIKNIFGYELNTYNEVVLDKIKDQDFDYIFFEDGAYNSAKSYLKFFKKEQMVLHFHHVGTSTLTTDATFDKFIGVSNCVCETFSKTSKIKKIYLLKNAIKISDFNKKISLKEIEQLKKSLGFVKDDFIVMYCGRLVKEKGVLELIKAFKKTNDKIKLMIVGSSNFKDGVKSDYTIKLEEECDGDSRIKFTGYINNNELYKYYNLAQVLVVPTLIPEAAALVTLEAMLCHTHIITTGTGGVKEYVANYGDYVKIDNNLIANLTKAINDCYLKKEKLNEKNQEKIKYIKNYSTENYYQNLINLISSFK